MDDAERDAAAVGGSVRVIERVRDVGGDDQRDLERQRAARAGEQLLAVQPVTYSRTWNGRSSSVPMSTTATMFA